MRPTIGTGGDWENRSNPEYRWLKTSSPVGADKPILAGCGSDMSGGGHIDSKMGYAREPYWAVVDFSKILRVIRALHAKTKSIGLVVKSCSQARQLLKFS